MNVNLLAWALNQALPAEQRAILTLMALLAAEAGSGDLYRGDALTLAVCALMPVQLVLTVMAKLQAVGLVQPTEAGYRMRVGVLAA